MLNLKYYEANNLEDNQKVYKILSTRELGLKTSRNLIDIDFDNIMKLYNLIKEHTDFIKTFATGGIVDDLINVKVYLEKSKEKLDEGFHHYALLDGVDRGEIKECLSERDTIYNYMLDVIREVRKNRDKLIIKFDERKTTFINDAKEWDEASKLFWKDVCSFNSWKRAMYNGYYYALQYESYFKKKIIDADKLILDFLE